MGLIVGEGIGDGAKGGRMRGGEGEDGWGGVVGEEERLGRRRGGEEER